METVLAAFIVIFVIVFAALSLSAEVITSQEALSVAQSQADARSRSRDAPRCSVGRAQPPTAR